MKPIIAVNKLSKKYHFGLKPPYYSFRDSLVSFIKNPFPLLLQKKKNSDELAEDEFWALEDITFTVQPGEVIGIIGRNGAGKTTLLKILSRITPPTKGKITLRGRVSSLLEVGTGFHPELTGRENIYLNGAIMGMKRWEVKKKFDDIVEFAEIEKFLDTPVKHFSSGMYMRLAFAVAAHLEPEILIVDEVLAVGDIQFQKKCLGRMENVAREGRTVLFVSHNMTAVLSLCQRVLFFDKGKIIQSGPVKRIVDSYTKQGYVLATTPLNQRTDRQGSGQIRVDSISILPQGKKSKFIVSSDGLEIKLTYQSKQRIKNPRIILGVYDFSGIPLFRLDSDMIGGLPLEIPEKGVIVCKTEPLHLSAGMCFVNLAVFENGEMADYIGNAKTFSVEANDYFGKGRSLDRQESLYLLKHDWSLL